jgi:hypothetical protein
MSDEDQKSSLPTEPVGTGSGLQSKGASNTSSDGKPAVTSNDSFNVPVKKSPLLIYALLQIPLVLFMVVLLYVMYQSRQN